MLKQKMNKKSFKSPFAKPPPLEELHQGQKKRKAEEEKKFPSTSGGKKPIFTKAVSKNAEESESTKKNKSENRNAEESENKKKKKSEGKKLPMTSLTNSQYEDIFSAVINTAVINKVQSEVSSSDGNNSDEGELEDRAAVPDPNEAYSPHEGAEEPMEQAVDYIESSVVLTKEYFKKKEVSVEHTKSEKISSFNKSDVITATKVSKTGSVPKPSKPFKSVLHKSKPTSVTSRKVQKEIVEEQTKKTVKPNESSGSKPKHYHCSQHSHHSSGHVCKKKQHRYGTASSQNSQPFGTESQSQQLFSQPPPELSLKERLHWLQERRVVGLWVQCSRSICNKWRYLNDIHDPVEVPDEWVCHMNSDKRYNSCAAPEKPPSPLEEEDLIHNEYTAGSIVWGRVDGYPWWPAMVDDCPDTEQYYWLNGFSDIPTHYNVVFFDEKDVTRAWLTPGKLRTFTGIETDPEFRKTTTQGVNFSKRIQVARIQAMKALTMNIGERLKTFSFLARHKGAFGTLKKKKDKRMKKRKHYSDESDEEEDGDDILTSRKNVENGNQSFRKKVNKKITSNSIIRKPQRYIEGQEEEEEPVGSMKYKNANNANNDSKASKTPKKSDFSQSSLYTQEFTENEIKKPKQKPLSEKKGKQFPLFKAATKNKKPPTMKTAETACKNPSIDTNVARQKKPIELSSSDDERMSTSSCNNDNDSDHLTASSQDLFVSDTEAEKENSSIGNVTKPIIEESKLNILSNKTQSTSYGAKSTSDKKSEQTKKTKKASTVEQAEFPRNMNNSTSTDNIEALSTSSASKLTSEQETEQTENSIEDSVRPIIGRNKLQVIPNKESEKNEVSSTNSEFKLMSGGEFEKTEDTTDDSIRPTIGCNKLLNSLNDKVDLNKAPTSSASNCTSEEESDKIENTTTDSIEPNIWRNKLIISTKERSDKTESTSTSSIMNMETNNNNAGRGKESETERSVSVEIDKNKTEDIPQGPEKGDKESETVNSVLVEVDKNKPEDTPQGSEKGDKESETVNQAPVEVDKNKCEDTPEGPENSLLPQQQSAAASKVSITTKNESPNEENISRAEEETTNDCSNNPSNEKRDEPVQTIEVLPSTSRNDQRRVGFWTSFSSGSPTHVYNPYQEVREAVHQQNSDRVVPQLSIYDSDPFEFEE